MAVAAATSIERYAAVISARQVAGCANQPAWDLGVRAGRQRHPGILIAGPAPRHARSAPGSLGRRGCQWRMSHNVCPVARSVGDQSRPEQLLIRPRRLTATPSMARATATKSRPGHRSTLCAGTRPVSSGSLTLGPTWPRLASIASAAVTPWPGAAGRVGMAIASDRRIGAAAGTARCLIGSRRCRSRWEGAWLAAVGKSGRTYSAWSAGCDVGEAARRVPQTGIRDLDGKRDVGLAAAYPRERLERTSNPATCRGENFRPRPVPGVASQFHPDRYLGRSSCRRPSKKGSSRIRVGGFHRFGRVQVRILSRR